MDKISVIIPTYNAQSTIEKCLYSILANRTDGKFDIEVVVVNDGSKDSTKNIVGEIVKSDSRVVLINQNNQGPSAARRNGVENSTGNYLAFCDSDDWVEKDWLFSMYSTLINNKADLSLVRAIMSTKVSDRGSSNLYIWDKDEAIKRFLKRDRINGSLVVKLFKRSLFDGIEWEPTMKYFEDDILIWQILQKCKKVAKLDSGKYYIELREDSLTASKFNHNRYLSTERLFDRIINDCRQSNLSSQIANALDFRYFVYCAHFKMMFRDNYYNAEEQGRMHNGLRESGFSKALRERGLANKLFAILLYFSPRVACRLYNSFKK